MPHRGPDTTPASTVVKYGDFAFHEHGMPTPFVTMDQEMLNEHNGRWGRIDNISINGIISGTGFFSGATEDDYGSGLIGMQSGLINGFSSDFKSFVIQDSGSSMDTVYSGEDCIVRGISFEESRYNMLVGYTINLQAHQSGYFSGTYGILDPVDEFSYDEQQEDEIITLTHNVSARGFKTASGQAFDNAKNFVTGRTGLSNKIYPEFVVTGSCDNWVLKNQSETIDRINGTYSTSEIYEMDPDNCSGVVTRYTCNLESGIQDDFVRGSIQGEVNAGKTGTLTGARAVFETLDIYGLFTGAVNQTNIDFNELPITYNSEEPSSTTKGEKKITFNAAYDNNNLFDDNNTFFQYTSGPCYFDYNVTINQDEVTEVTSVNLNGTIKSRGNLQQRIHSSSNFLTGNLLSGDNGTTRIKSLAQEALDAIKSDLTLPITHNLNTFPTNLSTVSGNRGTISVSATFDNADRVYDDKIRGSSFSVDVKSALPIYKPRPSINENGVSAIYKTNIFNREVVNINGQIVPDHRASSLAKDDTIEASGSGIVNTVRTALVSGANKRVEADTSNRSETDGALSFGTTFSFDSSGVYEEANTFIKGV
tara:strand:+ start:333 stop:2108 length:1776 start_codon:yes stop_codon:yes gene_type:complete